MLPVSPTQALAVARTEEVQRRARRAYLASSGGAAPSRVPAELRSLFRLARREAALRTRTASAAPAVCCA